MTRAWWWHAVVMAAAGFGATAVVIPLLALVGDIGA